MVVCVLRCLHPPPAERCSQGESIPMAPSPHLVGAPVEPAPDPAAPAARGAHHRRAPIHSRRHSLGLGAPRACRVTRRGHARPTSTLAAAAACGDAMQQAQTLW